MPEDDDLVAAYGLRLRGIPGVPAAASPPPEWPVWHVEQTTGDAGYAEGAAIAHGTARIGFPSGGGIRVDHAASTITFITERPMRAETVLHPGLVPAAAVIALWAGRAAVHASALLVGGGLWGFLADRGGGKSTTAALLSQRGCPLFADDMLILDGDTAFAGPSIIDLRPSAAEVLGGEHLGVIGRRERWRLRVPAAPLSTPLRGFVVLDWDDAVSFRELDLPERFRQLERHLSVPVQPEQLLLLAGLPMLRYARPRDIAVAGGAADALLHELSSRA